jgi:REP-associated tyrosine transposase
MYYQRPGRAKGFSYLGLARYLVTCCTDRRAPFFRHQQTVAETLIEIRHSAPRLDFAVITYCFMPDHLHLLLEATSERADLREVMHAVKQRAGFVFKRRTSQHLWQPGYHDHILRDDQLTLKVARYVLENPVRAGLAASPRDYPFLGSDVYPLDWLLEVNEQQA